MSKFYDRVIDYCLPPKNVTRSSQEGAKPHGDASYFERNRPWINPLLAGFIVSTTPMLLREIVAPSPLNLPAWLTSASLVLSLFCVGVGAAVTDTVSARIMLVIGTVFGIVVILYAALA